MYPVTELYQRKIKENNRIVKANIQIQHSKGVLFLSDKDLVLSTLKFSEGTQTGEEFKMGGTVASDILFTILNKPEYKDIDFMGARILGTISLLLREGADAHFLQPSQPSKMLNSNDLWEDVPIGKFNIDDGNKLRNTIEIKGIDDMANLDKSYSLSKISYPSTLYQIYVNICNVGDIPVGTTSFPNMNYMVNERPEGDLTLRDILGYVAELSGTFAKINREGSLELKWYADSGITLGSGNRFNFKPSDDEVRIKGIMAIIEETKYIIGTEDGAVDLSENPLLQGDYETVLNNIFSNVKDTIFTPYTSDWQGNPAIQAGDMITQVDRDGKKYNTLITKSTYKYRGRSQLEAKGLPEIAKGYKGSINRKIAQIKRLVEKEAGDKLTTLEQAQLNAMELMSNMLGGHFVVDEENGIYYISDNPDINLAKKIWKYGINGFAYYPDGLDSVPITAVTADGSIVAMLVAANIITANMIQTGMLQSEDGSTWINLDDGSFNFKERLKWINNEMIISSPSIDYAVEEAKEYTDGEIAKIPQPDLDDYALRQFGNGLMEISDSKGFVAYKDANKDEFTQLYPEGLFRVVMDGNTQEKMPYFYERDVRVVGQYTQKSYDYTQTPPSEATMISGTNARYTVQLPSHMAGKKFKILPSIYMGDGEYMNKFADAFRYQPVASGVKTIVRLESMSGKTWDGYSNTSAAEAIRNSGQFRVVGLYCYNYMETPFPYLNYVMIAFSIKVQLDVIA